MVGVDYSEPMLRKAQQRVKEHKLKHVEALAVMDGTRLGFPDGAFDAVLAQYVITTVPDPEGTLDEFARVTRPGGEIILVNHLGAESGLRRDFERSFAPMARKLGWQPEFSWARLEQWADAQRLRARDRAPADAAARAFLADPLRAPGDGETAANGGHRPRVAFCGCCARPHTRLPAESMQVLGSAISRAMALASSKRPRMHRESFRFRSISGMV